MVRAALRVPPPEPEPDDADLAESMAEDPPPIHADRERAAEFEPEPEFVREDRLRAAGDRYAREVALARDITMRRTSLEPLVEWVCPKDYRALAGVYVDGGTVLLWHEPLRRVSDAEAAAPRVRLLGPLADRTGLVTAARTPQDQVAATCPGCGLTSSLTPSGGSTGLMGALAVATERDLRTLPEHVRDALALTASKGSRSRGSRRYLMHRVAPDGVGTGPDLS